LAVLPEPTLPREYVTPMVLTDIGPKLSGDARPPAAATIRAREMKWSLPAETVEFPVSYASEESMPSV